MSNAQSSTGGRGTTWLLAIVFWCSLAPGPAHAESLLITTFAGPDESSGAIDGTGSATGLPSWASVNTTTGEITGTPDAAGNTSATISATNAGGTDTAALNIVINPAPATWTATGSMGTARSGQSSIVLNNGKVLVIGGGTAGPALSVCEVYDPATGAWASTGSLATARACPAVLLPSGKVLAAGGNGSAGNLSSCELYDPASGTWSATGSMANNRHSFTLTLLGSGKVLAAGGDGPPAVLSACELYDPASGTWSATGSLITARYRVNAVLLKDGRVLVTGGNTQSTDGIAACEVYNPISETWASTAALSVGRRSHTATLLPDGRVLAVGGTSSGNIVTSCEIYDPATASWSVAASMSTARTGHTSVLLPNGLLLAISGRESYQSATTACELYNCVTGTWQATKSVLTSRAAAASATILPNGRVLLAGGWNIDNTFDASCELYDCAGAGSWSATGTVSVGRYKPAALLLPNSKPLVIGGANSGGYTASCMLYDEPGETWTETGNLSTGRNECDAVLLPNGKILAAGGYNASPLQSCELYDMASGLWSATGGLSTGRCGLRTVLLDNGKVLAVGGQNGAPYTASCELYNPANGSWSSTGSMATSRWTHTATVLNNGKVLAVGGNTNSGQTATCELYDPSTGTWTATGSLSAPRQTHTATLLPNGKVLVTGGINGAGADVATCELYDPSAGTWTPTGSLATARHYHSAVLLPNGRVLVAGGYLYASSSGTSTVEVYNPATGTWSLAGDLTTGRYGFGLLALQSGRILAVAGSNLPNGDANGLSSSELYDPGLGFQDSWRPVISSATSPLTVGTKLDVSGSLFKGLSEASSAYQSSATNYPLVQLRSLVNDQCAFLLSDPNSNWSDTSFTSVPVNDFPPGPAEVTVFTNGIPSLSQAIAITPPAASRILVETAADGSGTVVPAQTVASGHSITVYAITRDASNNFVANVAATWSLLSKTGGVVDGDLVASGDTKSATFTGHVIGTAVIDAASDGFTKTDSGTITVVPGPAHTLLVSGFPSPTTSGVAGNVNVTVQDTYGNTATSYTGSVHFTSSDTQAVLPGDYTFVSGDNGRHSFSLTLLTVGTQSITAADKTTSSITGTQSGIAVSPVLATWTATASMATAKYAHCAILLQNGKVLVSGGLPVSTACWLYDPTTNTWTATGDMTTARCETTSVLLPNGKVLCAGGYNGGFLNSCELYDPATGTWSDTGSFPTARQLACLTLLANGEILLSGGTNDGSSTGLATCARYNPASGKWTATGSLASGRHRHAAVLLADGKVLAVGGWAVSNTMASCELYDPAAGTWSTTGSLASARYTHSGILLPSGKVLAVGGLSAPTTTLSSCELYDPATGAWSAAPSLSRSSHDHTTSLLPCGRVLVVGGASGSNSGYANNCDLYDPVSNTWSVTTSLASAREYHTTTLLPSGKVLVTGGYNGTVLSSCEIYDYTGGGSWTPTANLATTLHDHTATRLSNGKVLVAGGQSSGGTLASAALYDPGTGTWSAAGNLAAARTSHTATLLPSGKVLVTAGYNSGWITSAELYDPGTNTWITAGNLATARSGHTHTLLLNGKVLVVGGWNGSGTASVELYDPGTNSWRVAASLATARGYHTATLLPNGKVLVAGGQVGPGSFLASAELYDPGTNTWSAAASLGGTRGYHVGALLPNGKVLVAGGYGGAYLTSAELYDPGTNTWSAASSLATARGYYTATLLPSGRVLIAGGASGGGVYHASAEMYDPGTNTWSAAGSLTTARTEHTATLLSNGKVLVAGGSNGSPLSSAELYDPGLGFQGSWRPVISSVASPLNLGAKLSVSGSLFKGISEASGGGYQSSATNYPLVQLRSLVNDQCAFLLSDPNSNWSDTSFTSAAVSGFPTGPAEVTVFTNGIPSLSKSLTIACAPRITSVSPFSGPPAGGTSVTITGTGFTGATAVTFGGVAAGSFTVSSDTRMTCTTPAHSAGFVAVAVTTANGTGTLANGFFYDGSTWTATGSLSGPRLADAVLLQSGKLLAISGNTGSGTTATCEVYDPATGLWAAAASVATKRYDGTATVLSNGKVLYAGGDTGPVPTNASEVYDPATDSWTTTASMAQARCVPTATLLANGKVLVAGGNGGSGGVASCELFDPSTGTWSPTSNMAVARTWHAAVLLPSGKVLVTGGGPDANSGYTSCELYDPASGTWSTTGSMSGGRQAHSMTLMPGGRVLVSGGGPGQSSSLTTCEVYDTATGTWASTGSLATARFLHGQALLPNGKVIAFGGYNGGALNSCQLYDPATGTWASTASLATARYQMSATLLPNGRLVVLGGATTPAGRTASCEVYDYTGAGNWSATGSMAVARENPTLTLLPSGKVLVAGGHSGSNVYPTNTELYDPSTDTWSAAGNLASTRAIHAAVLLPSGKVLVVGGTQGGTSVLASSELYDPGANTWSAAGSLANARAWHSAALLPSGKVLVAGGAYYNGGWVARSVTELYDTGTNTWNAASSLATARWSHTATLLPNGKVLVAGGFTGGNNVTASAELYDPGTNMWSAAGSLSIARGYHTATLLPSGRVLVAAGWNGSTWNVSSAELYDPGTNTWSAAASLIAGHGRHTATLLANGKVLVAAGTLGGGNVVASAELYDPGTNTWSAAGSLATARQDHRAVQLPGGKALVVGGWPDPSGNALSSCEIFDPGAAFQDSWRPVIGSVTSPLNVGSKLNVSGSLFKGISEASGGGYQSSATNYPLVQLRSLVNDQCAFLLSDPTSNWSDTAFTSAPVNGFPQGYAQVTVFTNGIPSLSHTILVSGPTNHPPTANAGSDQVVEQTSAAGAQVTLDGSASFDPDGGPLTYHWTWLGGVATGIAPSVSLSPGATQVTLVVNDGVLDSAPATVTVTVRDTTPPVLTVPPDVTAEQSNRNGTPVSIGQATAMDICDPAPVVGSDAPAVFPLGTTIVTWIATDASGKTATAFQRVTIVDTTPPELSCSVKADTATWKVIYLETQPGSIEFTDSGQRLPVAGTLKLLLVDLDNDGRPDLIQCNYFAPPYFEWTKVFHNDGRGFLQDTGQILQQYYGYAGAAAVGDVNNDGYQDAFTGSTATVWQGPGSLHINDGTGRFIGTVTKNVAGGNMWSAGFVDVNNDGNLDLVVGEMGGYAGPGGFTVYRNDGQANFTTDRVRYGAGDWVSDLAFLDANNDGWPDIITAGDEGVIYLNDGAGGLGGGSIHLGDIGRKVRTGDLNGDGLVDIATSNGVLMNRGGGLFTPNGQALDLGYDFCLADIDGDGALDIVVSPYSGPSYVMLNDGSGSFHRAYEFPASTRGANLAVGDVNGDGKPDVLFAGPGGITEVWFNASVPPQPSRAIVEQTTRTGTRVEFGCTATDICDASPTIVCNPPSGTIFPLGDTVVTCTATDASGNQAQRTFTVSVVDTTPPVNTAPPDVTAEQTNRDGTPVSIGQAIATDICDASPFVTHDAPAVFPLGTTTVTWTATDVSGNVATATQRVTVVDTTPPVITVPADITVEQATVAGTAVDFSVLATDICDAAPIVAATPSSGSVFPLGTTVVTVTAADASANTSTKTFNVTVRDTTPPVITLLGANPQYITYGTAYSELGVTATDNVDGDITSLIQTDISALLPAVGHYQVKYTVSDSAGNACTAYRDVYVTPKALAITAKDNCKKYGDIVTFEGVEFTSSGLVNDDTVTSVTLTSAGATATAAVGGYQIVPNAAVGSGLDNYTIGYLDGTLTVGPAALTITANNASKTYGAALAFVGDEFTTSGLVYGDSVTSVALTSAGVAATADVAGSPYAISPSEAVGTGLGNYTITYKDGSLTVGKADLIITRSLPEGATFYEATWVAGTEVQFSVNAQDAFNNDVTATAVWFTGVSAIDTHAYDMWMDWADGFNGLVYDVYIGEDGNGNVLWWVNPGNTFPVGTTTVTWHADSGPNYNSRTGDFTLEVKHTTLPAFSGEGTQFEFEADTTGGELKSTVLAAVDVVAYDSVQGSPQMTNDAPDVFPLGTTTLTFTATDCFGLTAMYVVTVTVKDRKAPVITNTPANVVVEQATHAGTVVNLTPPTATDICDPNPTLTSNAPAIFPLGTTIVRFTATDHSGNSSYVEMSATVVDTTPPVLTNAPKPVVVEQATLKGTAVSLTPPTVTDNCDANVTVHSDAPAIFPLGTTTVTFTATDASGKSAIPVTTTVTVLDRTVPSKPTSQIISVASNNNMRQAYFSGTDICDCGTMCHITGVTCADASGNNIPISAAGQEKKNQTPDYNIAANDAPVCHVNLRAIMGRIYMVTGTITDHSGNTVNFSCPVTVVK